MKRIYIQLLLVLLLATAAHAQGWKWLNPKPEGNNLASVFFLDENTGYAVGDYGIIIKTSDGGTTWVQQNSCSDAMLTSVCFPDSFTGYCSGYILSDTMSEILKTIDGGETWTKKIVPGS